MPRTNPRTAAEGKAMMQWARALPGAPTALTALKLFWRERPRIEERLRGGAKAGTQARLHFT